jgi:hypothetical protein
MIKPPCDFIRVSPTARIGSAPVLAFSPHPQVLVAAGGPGIATIDASKRCT